MSSHGYLEAHAFTSDAMIPVEDTLITVTKVEEGPVELLAAWLTDESGQTPVLLLETPDIELSQSPSEERPFSLVNITAEHPLYEKIVINNVQIFPDTTSMQPLQLIPHDEFPEAWDRTEVFDIPPQNL